MSAKLVPEAIIVFLAVKSNNGFTKQLVTETNFIIITSTKSKMNKLKWK